MSQLLATLYPSTFIPPKGRLVPRARVILSDKDIDCTNRNLNRVENREECYRLIKSGLKTSKEISDVMKLSPATALIYFRELEALKRCYRIERRSNQAMWMFAHPEKLREAA